VVTSATPLTTASVPVPDRPDASLPARAPAKASLGYLVPWGSSGATLVTDALQQGLRVRSVGGSFTLGGRTYPIGTALIRAAENPADLHERLSALVARHGAEVIPIDSAYVDSGTSLGSNLTAYVRAPRVLLAWDQPTQSLSAGWTRYVLERRFGQSVTAVRTASLTRARLEDFDVLVLPSGSYAGAISEATVARLKDWIRGGGTLVTVAEASRWAATSSVGLLDTTLLLKDGRPDTPASGSGTAGSGSAGSSGGSAGNTATGFNYDKAIQPDRERPDSQPGALLRAAVDTEHWLSAGHDAETQVVIEGARVFAPIKLNSGRNVVVFAPKDRLVASGLIWPDGQDVLAQKAYLMHQPLGQGHVIAFAEDPNYRGYTEATMLLFMNAVLLGPAY
jgi:hypothetical protein